MDYWSSQDNITHVGGKMSNRIIRIGTRGSKLALVQTELVENALRSRFSDMEFERVIFKTEADRDEQKTLAEFGGTGVFVRELERALLCGEIDVAVHSAKDMPVTSPEGLCVAGVLPREDVRDVLVYRREFGEDIGAIVPPFVVGTGSPRRQAQLEGMYPHFSCAGIRGNVPTRLNKVRKGEYDGVILAAAGLIRLGLMEQREFRFHLFSEEEIIPAGGQAIIAIEACESNEIIPCVKSISDEKAYFELMVEQEILKGLNAGCHEPVAVRACFEHDIIRVSAGRASMSGEKFWKVTAESIAAEWEKSVADVVEKLLYLK